MALAARTYSSEKYRYGFNGKEKDGDIGGDEYDYGLRIYDARLGRFLSVDPLTKDYPWYTPYQFGGNNPIKFIDQDGAEPYPSAENLKKTESILSNAMGTWYKRNDMLLGAAMGSVNARPHIWWQHAHGYANNNGNRTFNNMKGAAGEAIGANAIAMNFEKHINTLDFNGTFNMFNDPSGSFEGMPGGTWDFFLNARFIRTQSNNHINPIWGITLFHVNGLAGRPATFDLATPKKFLFEIKTLDPDASKGSLYLNIETGFNQAIKNAQINPKAYSILVVDQQAYQNMWNGASATQKATIEKLYNQLIQLNGKNNGNGALWLVDGLESRAKELANTTYHELKSNITNEDNSKCEDDKK